MTKSCYKSSSGGQNLLTPVFLLDRRQDWLANATSIVLGVKVFFLPHGCREVEENSQLVLDSTNFVFFAFPVEQTGCETAVFKPPNGAALINAARPFRSTHDLPLFLCFWPYLAIRTATAFLAIAERCSRVSVFRLA